MEHSVLIEVVIEADSRHEAWKKARDLTRIIDGKFGIDSVVFKVHEEDGDGKRS